MADAVVLRPAIGEDIELLGALARDPAVEPYLAPGAWERPSLTAWLERDPGNGAPPTGLYVIDSPSGEPLGVWRSRSSTAGTAFATSGA